MASETLGNIKATEEMRKKNGKAMIENIDLESKLIVLHFINEKYLNMLEFV